MSESTDFGQIVAIVAVALAGAIVSSRLSARLRVPAPGLFLAAAAVASDVWPQLANAISVRDVERLCVVALIVILFNGGMDIGVDRFRESLWPILSLGVLGTFLTAGVMMIVVHALTGLGWMTSLLIGSAVAPTDPAAVFSVLGGREIDGRSDHILKAESGVNDPVGIALVVGLLAAITSGDSWTGIPIDFLVEMGIGTVFGVAGGLAIAWLLRTVRLPDEALVPLFALALAGVLYGLPALSHGSGFLAVFIAGLVVSGAHYPHRREVEHVSEVLASLGEIVVFIALGLTVDLSALDLRDVVLDGLLIAVALTVLARPLAVAVTLAPAHLARGEKTFIAWAGIRGAVPILLAAFALLESAPHAQRVYGIVFVVVMFSVVVQGALLEPVARRCGLTLRTTPRTDPQMSDSTTSRV